MGWRVRVIGVDWKEATSSMTDEEFKKELTLFADHVEAKKAHGILIDVARFRHKPGPDMQEWRVKNISGRYYGAGVRRFAFLFPAGVPIPPMMNQSSPGENFDTRAFNRAEEALTWLKAADADPASIVRKFLEALGASLCTIWSPRPVERSSSAGSRLSASVARHAEAWTSSWLDSG